MNVSREIQLKDYLIAGTDPSVIQLYLSLPERAENLRFGLVEDEVVIVDTETTGFNPSSCSLIEIAAVRLRGNDIVEQYQTYVDPGSPIPESITELTGIQDSDVEGAPSPSEAVAALAAFAGDCNLVAHNATFDQSFVMRQVEPGMLPGDWVDSLALSQIALPRMRSHRLVDLARAFGLHIPTHDAIDDTRALAQLWRILLAALQAMQPGLAGRIADLSPEFDWPLRPYFAQAALSFPGVDFSLRSNRKAKVHSSALPDRGDAEGRSLEFFDEAYLRDAFDEGGLVEEMYPGFEPRPNQMAMASEVASSLIKADIRVIEAGTGIGKSMAYLLPFALAARENNMTMGVATKTNALMDQLIYNELPRLREALEGLSYIALKGYDHYLCLRKLEAAARSNLDSCEAVNMVAALLSCVAQTTHGDLDALNINWRGLPRADIQANQHDCLKRRCPFYPNLCYLHGARKAADGADIVVTNHALLFRDMQTDNGILPPIRHWVIDEAHSVEAEARRQLSFEVSSTGLERALHRLTNPKAGVTSRVRKRADNIDGGSMLYNVTADIENHASQIQRNAAEFFSLVSELKPQDKRTTGQYSQATVWIDPDLRASGAWTQLTGPGYQLAENLKGLTKRIADFVSMLEQYTEEFSTQLAEISALQNDVNSASEALRLILDGADDRFVYAVELSDSPRFSSQKLEALFLDVGQSLLTDLYPNVRSLIFTSATLSTAQRDPFAHFAQATGLDRVENKEVVFARFESGYDYDRNMTVLLPSDVGDPYSPTYRQDFARLLYEVHVAMGGSVLTLFTNRREMESLYHELKPELARVGIELIAQTRGMSTKALRDKFIANENVSMFALKSFWEGFDAPGDTLRCVVIARLPFGRPDDPVSSERELREGRAAWHKYSLPEAIKDLKQAAGRLIRSSTDSGWLILADSRLQTKSYASAFLRSMPTSDVRTLDTEEIVRIIENQSPGLV